MNPSFGYNIQRRRRFVKTLCGKKIRPLSRQEFSEENAGIAEKKKFDGITPLMAGDDQEPQMDADERGWLEKRVTACIRGESGILQCRQKGEED